MALLINGRYLTRPVTGVERYSDMMLEVIAREWPNSRVAVPGRWSGPLEIHGLEVVRVGGVPGHAWEQLQLPSALGKGELLFSPANSGPLRVRRQVVAVHDLAVIHHPEWFDRRFAAWYRFLLPRLTRRVAGVITVSGNSERDLVHTYGLRTDHVHVVPPFSAATRTAGTDPGIGSPYFLMVASQNPRKGHDRALDWFRSLEHPAFKFVLVGRSGAAFKAMDAISLDGSIVLNDVDDERLRALYCGAIALIQPSRHEGFGLPILEAMAHGCPVIASDLPVFREEFGDAVLFAEVGASKSMREAMVVMNDPAERAALIIKGHRKAETFSFERTAKELHKVVDPLLNV